MNKKRLKKEAHSNTNGKNELREKTRGQALPKALPKTLDELKFKDGSVQYVPVQGNVEIAVSSSLEDLDTYVLKEQEGWFDPEYKFLLEITQPGMKMVDFDAGKGIYAIPLAKKSGKKGHIWATTKTKADAQFILSSRKHNRLNNIDIFIRDDGTSQLDQEMERTGFFSIDLVRIPFMTGNSDLLQDGKRFFSENSPLVMFGLRHDKRVINTEVIAQFRSSGYDAYCLIPGLNLLIPYTSDIEIDLFTLNLFFCKGDRADRLVQQGYLVRQINPLVEIPGVDAGAWKKYLGAFSYTSSLMEGWISPARRHAEWEVYGVALNLYSRAKEQGQSSGERYAYLNASYGILSLLGEANPTLPRLLSLCRVMIEMGKREAAVRLLGLVFNIFEEGGEIHLNEPFIALSDKYAALDPEDRLAEWLFASVLEQRETCRAFSSYFTGKESLPVLEAIQNTGFHPPEIERRIALIKMRYHNNVNTP